MAKFLGGWLGASELRRVVLAAAGLAVAVTLLLSLKTGPGVTRLPERMSIEQLAPVDVTGAPPAGGPGPSPDPASPPPDPTAGVVYTGDSIYTEFGYVTVQITVLNGQIIDVVALELPREEARSVALSERVAPILRERALAAQSAAFDVASGATWTSEAYRQSLQTALVKAGLA